MPNSAGKIAFLMRLYSRTLSVPWAVRMCPPIRTIVGRTVLWLGLVVECFFLAVRLGGQVFGSASPGPYLVPIGPRGNWYDLPPPPSTSPPQPFDQEQFCPSSTLASPSSVLDMPLLSLRCLPSPSTSTLAPAALLHLRMPPQLHKLRHHTKLSWHLTKRRQGTKDRQFAKEYFRRKLESFRQEIRNHYILEFRGSHRFYACGPHSGQFYSTPLQALLSLDYLPHQVKIPCWHLSHVCAYCHRVPLPNNL